jgi:hypothetical protein
VNKEAYIRKSHSFTKESLEYLGILSRYMGDIGESAVLRYLIINEIRKVPNPHEYGELTERGADMFNKGWVGVFSDKPMVIRDGVLREESKDKEGEDN